MKFVIKFDWGIFQYSGDVNIMQLTNYVTFGSKPLKIGLFLTF
jgi:hypothetical protein